LGQARGGAIRLMTSGERVQVHHLCERFGWRKIGEVKAYEGASLSGERHGFTPVAEAEIDEALGFATEHLQVTSGLIDLSWRFAQPDRETMAESQRAGMLYWSPSTEPSLKGSRSGALVSLWSDEEDGQPMLGVSMIACVPERLTSMLSELRRLAGSLSLPTVLWHAPAQDRVESDLQAAGYVSRYPGSAYLFGREG
jgi:hypothetical protein